METTDSYPLELHSLVVVASCSLTDAISSSFIDANSSPICPPSPSLIDVTSSSHLSFTSQPCRRCCSIYLLAESYALFPSFIVTAVGKQSQRESLSVRPIPPVPALQMNVYPFPPFERPNFNVVNLYPFPLFGIDDAPLNDTTVINCNRLFTEKLVAVRDDFRMRDRENGWEDPSPEPYHPKPQHCSPTNNRRLLVNKFLFCLDLLTSLLVVDIRPK
ncbi:hypothetical protein ACLOJK_011911 [Asimina triloba]